MEKQIDDQIIQDIQAALEAMFESIRKEGKACQNEALKAFRIGWKAGAYYSAFQMLHWICTEILGIKEPERNEQPNE